MTDPTRWRDPDGAAPSGARGLLEAARETRPMTAADRARSAKRVARIATLPAATGALAWLHGVAAAAGIGAASAVVLLGVIAVVEARRDAEPGPRAAVSEPEPRAAMSVSAAPRASAIRGVVASAAAPSAEVPPSAPLPADPKEGAPIVRAALPRLGNDAPAPEDTPPASPPPMASVVAPEGDPLAREAALLEEARRLLAGSPGAALGRLDEHARSFPRGELGVEREFLAIDALRRLGRAAEAKGRAEALLARWAGSPYEARVRRMLASLP